MFALRYYQFPIHSRMLENMVVVAALKCSDTFVVHLATLYLDSVCIWLDRYDGMVKLVFNEIIQVQTIHQLTKSVLYIFLCMVQYPVACPFSSITCGTTLRKCHRHMYMYLVHLAMSTVVQNCLIPFTSSSFVFGFISRHMNSFNSCHKVSIGFKSGDLAGVSTNWFRFLPSQHQHTLV